MTLALRGWITGPFSPEALSLRSPKEKAPRGQLGRSEPARPAPLSSSPSCLVSANHGIVVSFIVVAVFMF